MASSSTADPASSVPDAATRAPFDSNIAEVVLNKELFESQGIDIVDFTRRLLSVKETRGIAVDRQGVETYWSMGVKLAYEHAHYKRSSLVGEVRNRKTAAY